LRPFPTLLAGFAVVLIAAAVFSQQETTPESSFSFPEEPYIKTTDDAALNLHRWGAVTLFHGLPSERVNAITEDVNGALWFGTDNGLVRYDGRRTEAVGSVGSGGDNRGVLPSQRIRALFRDSSGGLWIGTDQGAVRFVRDKLTLLEETRGRVVTSIAETPNKEIAIVTEFGQIICYQNQPSSQSAVQTAPTVAITDSQTQSLLSIDNSPLELKAIVYNSLANEFWLGSHRRGALTFKETRLREAASPPTRPYFVNALFAEGEMIWLGAQARDNESGLWLHRESSASPLERQSIITGTINAIHGGKGEVWLGTDKQGALFLRDGFLIERLTFESTKGGLRSNRIYAVYRDREGIVWFGTDRGVCRYDRDSFRTTTLSNDAQSNYIRSLLTTSDGVIYAGTNRGLFRLSAGLELGGWQQIADIGTRQVYTLLESSQGKLLVGTSAGLFSAPAGSSNFTLVAFENNPEKGSVRALAEVAGTVYAVIFERGLAKLEAEALKLISTDAAAKKATCLAVAATDKLLHIGTSDGLRFTFENGRWQEQRASQPATEAGSGLIHALATIDESLWIGRETGLSVIENNQARLVLPYVDVRWLTVAREGEDNHPVLYCATKNQGLYKLLPESGAQVRIDTEQGLPSQQVFAVTKAKSGEVWIGTNRGIVRHQPNFTAPILEPRRMVADKIYTPDSLTTELRFPAYQKNYLLEFAGLGSKTFPSQFQYEYTLTEDRRGPLKKIVTSDAQFQLTDLATGDYAITARAISRDLIYSAPFQFKLRIAPEAVSRTTILLTALLILAIGAGGYAFYQQRRTAKANQKLEVINTELRDTRIRLANITEAERSRIARDLHDQTLADLRHLLVMTDQLETPLPHQPSPTPSSMRRKIEEVSREIRHICEDLSPSVLENIGFVPALEWALTDAVAHLPADEKFAYSFVCEPDLEERLDLTPTEQIQLYRIVQEALNNVCRHAKAKKVELRVAVAYQRELVIAVIDDGIGLAATPENPTGHGMANIRSRANLIGAEVEWRDVRQGSYFVVRKEQAVR
jgi:signal transduction histidine kinase/ligand-binding sensor domain-containing protein